MKQLTQTYNDGVVNIYSVGNIAAEGNKPKDGLTIKVGSLHYEERIVGMSRFWAAKQGNSKIELMIRTPQRREISSQDIAIPVDGKQYRIVQVQYPQEVVPPSMDLSLERVEAEYEII